MVSSHPDKKPMGTRYDDILGVLAGLERLRLLHGNSVQIQQPCWLNRRDACLASHDSPLAGLKILAEKNAPGSQ